MKKHHKNAAKDSEGTWKRRSVLLFLAVSMVPLYYASSSVFTVLAQKRDSTNKTIKKLGFRDSSVREPVEILEIRSNGKIVRFDEAFADDNWLKDFTIKFKNVSGKTITNITFRLIFPETASAGEPVGIPTSHDLIYGLFQAQQKAGAIGMKSLAPGETDEVTLGPTSFAKLKALSARRRDLNDLTTANMTLVVAYFDDGMQWSAGDMFRPDPDRPGHYIVAKDNTQIKETDKKKITKVSYNKEPIAMLAIESDGREIKLDEPFEQQGDWLKDLKIRFKNVSDKPIAVATITLNFPETRLTGHLMAHTLMYGTSAEAREKIDKAKQEFLAPGQEAEVGLSVKGFEIVKNFLDQRQLLSDLTEVNIKLNIVQFEDGISWVGGDLYRNDPQKPHSLIKIDAPTKDEK